MSINLEPEILNKIKLVLKENQKVKSLILFGSRAKGTAKNGSDIDLAIVGDDISFRDLCQLGMNFDELDLPYKIDLVNYEAIKNEDLKEHINRVGVVL